MKFIFGYLCITFRVVASLAALCCMVLSSEACIRRTWRFPRRGQGWASPVEFCWSGYDDRVGRSGAYVNNSLNYHNVNLEATPVHVRSLPPTCRFCLDLVIWPNRVVSGLCSRFRPISKSGISGHSTGGRLSCRLVVPA